MAVPPEDYGRLQLLGSGGTARVFLDYKNTTKKPFALKTPLPDGNTSTEDFTRLIIREYSLIGRLKYPGLVRLHGIDESITAPSLSMEYCPGRTLDQIEIINDIHVLLNLISSISINLYYLHLAGISHGDLKPHNIFLIGDLDDYDSNVPRYTKISDCSLALKAGEPKSERLGLGTVGYMAPETIDGGILNNRSDIFALGIIAYRLAAGRHPFMDNDYDPVRVNSRIKEHNPDEPIAVNPKIPESLSRMIMTMLTKTPEKRPPNGYAICRELEKIGATIPFRKMIRPRHIIGLHRGKTPEYILQSECLDFNDGTIRTLLDYSGDDACHLRTILEINFNKDTFKWKDGKLTTDNDNNTIVWPKRLRDNVWQAFPALSFSQKKKCIFASVCETREDAVRLDVLTERENSEYATRPLMTCLKGSLSKATVIRTADRLGHRAESMNLKETAAGLYMTAGNITDGHEAVMQAVEELKNQNEYSRAVALLNRLEELCLSRGDNARLKTTLKHKAIIAKLTGEVSQAIKTYDRIVELYRNNSSDRFLADVYKELGDLYKMKQNYKAGIKALRKAEIIFSDIGDQLELSRTINNIGNIYWIGSQYDQAYACYRRALRIQRRLNAVKDVACTLNNIAPIFYFRQRYDRCLRLYDLSLRLKRETGNQLEIARTVNNMGFIYSELGDFDRSLDYLSESREINHKIGNNKELLFNLENLTQVLLSAGKLHDSIEYLKEGMNLSDRLSDRPHKGVFLRGMGSVQKWMGLYGQAYNNVNQAIDICRELDDDRRLIICLIQQADLLARMNVVDEANKICRQISLLSEKLEDRRAAISVDLVRCQLYGDIKAADRAVETAREIKNNRDRHLALLYKADCHLSENRTEESYKVIQSLDSVFVEGSSDILNARYANIRGRYFMLTGDNNKAIRHYGRGLSLASASALLPEKLDASCNLGTIYTKKNEFEAAFRYLKNAFNDARTMAEDIENVEYRKQFLGDKKISSMAAEIKRLSSILSKK